MYTYHVSTIDITPLTAVTLSPNVGLPIIFIQQLYVVYRSVRRDRLTLAAGDNKPTLPYPTLHGYLCSLLTAGHLSVCY